MATILLVVSSFCLCDLFSNGTILFNDNDESTTIIFQTNRYLELEGFLSHCNTISVDFEYNEGKRHAFYAFKMDVLLVDEQDNAIIMLIFEKCDLKKYREINNFNIHLEREKMCIRIFKITEFEPTEVRIPQDKDQIEFLFKDVCVFLFCFYKDSKDQKFRCLKPKTEYINEQRIAYFLDVGFLNNTNEGFFVFLKHGNWTIKKIGVKNNKFETFEDNKKNSVLLSAVKRFSEMFFG